MDQAERLRKLVEKKPEATLPQVNGNARVIAVTSGKGGVGKTNLTVNLAIALGITGQRVLVIDADLGMANVEVVLGSSTKKHLLNLLEDGTKLTDVLVHGPYGVDYISGGSGIEKAQAFDGAQKGQLLTKLMEAGAVSYTHLTLLTILLV